MRPQKVTNNTLMEGVISVFRSKGYDGATLNDLAEACGLQKASLYHRFPKGKKEIATAALTYINNAIEEHIYKILANKEIHPKKRLLKVLKNIDTYYHGGERACMLRTMSMDTGLVLFGNNINSSMKKWIESFLILGVDMGYNVKEANQKALKTLILIQGSLIVSKGVSDTAIFKNTLEEIENLYTKK